MLEYCIPLKIIWISESFGNFLRRLLSIIYQTIVYYLNKLK